MRIGCDVSPPNQPIFCLDAPSLFSRGSLCRTHIRYAPPQRPFNYERVKVKRRGRRCRSKPVVVVVQTVGNHWSLASLNLLFHQQISSWIRTRRFFLDRDVPVRDKSNLRRSLSTEPPDSMCRTSVIYLSRHIYPRIARS